MEMGDIIRGLVDQFLEENHWLKNAQEINEGECATFAELICKAVPGARRDRAPGHVFAFFEGRYYDSEAPDGVDHWTKLPFFTEERYGRVRAGAQSELEQERAAA